MHTFVIVPLVFFGLIAAGALAVVIRFVSSPMPVVRRLRGGMDGEIKYPSGSDGIKDTVTIQRDLEYRSKYGNNRFDLYLPKKDGACPLIVWVHGGAFVAGDKAGVENWGVMLASNGYAVAAVNYQWAPEAAYPAQLVQITEALAAIEKISDGRIDLSRTAIAGDSAGAHMAAQLALLHTSPAFAKRLNITSPLARDALKCALLYCGPYSLRQMLNSKKRLVRLFVSRIGWSYLGRKNWKKAPLADTITLVDFVTADYVPTYLTDGNSYSFEGQARELGERLRSLGVPTAERYFPREQFGEVTHEYQMDLTQQNAMDCFHDTLRFLELHL